MKYEAPIMKIILLNGGIQTNDIVVNSVTVIEEEDNNVDFKEPF